MKFEKLRNKFKKKEEKELPTNPINDLFYAFDTERDSKESKPVEELPDDMKELEETKRARYELIKKKYRNAK